MRQLLAALPAGERVRRYRQMAAEAFEHAETAHDETMRTGYLALASGWQVLALEIEHSGKVAHPGNDAAQDPDPCAALVGAKIDNPITRT